MKLAIMQPYFIPYIGYFSLISSVDIFTFLDDVQYIRRGWINRNYIKINNSKHYITLPVSKMPIKTKINEIYTVPNERSINSVKLSIKMSYKKSPYYDDVSKLILNHIKPNTNLSTINEEIIKEICGYLNITTNFHYSSLLNLNNLHREDKLISICKSLGAKHYINAPGGKKLYTAEKFNKNNISLHFINPQSQEYYQGKGDFIPNLSIIDALMWNPPETVLKLIHNYTLS